MLNHTELIYYNIDFCRLSGAAAGIIVVTVALLLAGNVRRMSNFSPRSFTVRARKMSRDDPPVAISQKPPTVGKFEVPKIRTKLFTKLYTRFCDC